MDVSSFKTIIDIQKNDMKQFLKDNNHSSNPEHNHRKAEWSAFFKEARTQSRKKTRKLNSSKKKGKRGEGKHRE